jgi:formylglycine-generating enzyme
MTARVFPDPFPPACATAWGDDRYGLWCEITVKGVVQRLRWIEPGAFWMGSTDEERASFGAKGDDWFRNWIKNEAPRHRVVLTQGFWLADTACTQALWLAVVGDSPSQFKGPPDLPVESVSWDDVTMKFLPMLNPQLAEAEVSLPSEAQWEHACRARTHTVFHFGEMANTKQVNCEFASGCTLSVKALPANGWGLYQMHGNLWEWCTDAPRRYRDECATDPYGGQDGPDRVFRGGSWGLFAGWTRSAFRGIARCDYRNSDAGFRFVMRSVEPSR